MHDAVTDRALGWLGALRARDVPKSVRISVMFTRWIALLTLAWVPALYIAYQTLDKEWVSGTTTRIERIASIAVYFAGVLLVFALAASRTRTAQRLERLMKDGACLECEHIITAPGAMSPRCPECGMPNQACDLQESRDAKRSYPRVVRVTCRSGCFGALALVAIGALHETPWAPAFFGAVRSETTNAVFYLCFVASSAATIYDTLVETRAAARKRIAHA